jgi:hypothetical protein
VSATQGLLADRLDKGVNYWNSDFFEHHKMGGNTEVNLAVQIERNLTEGEGS